MDTIKDYLTYEGQRNKKNAHIYTTLMRNVFGRDRKACAVLIGHHLTFELDGDLNTENELPSADCLMFDHQVMKAAFGAERYIRIMQALASVPAEDRDVMLAQYMEDSKILAPGWWNQIAA
jgi:DNA-directed RNA polymerase specialized sigma24 family protein